MTVYSSHFRAACAAFVALSLTGSGNAQQITRLTNWVQHRDPFASSGNAETISASAPMAEHQGARVTVNIGCVRTGQDGAGVWPPQLRFHIGVSGTSLDIANTSVRHDGGSIMAPSTSYSNDRSITIKEKVDDNSPVENTFSAPDDHNVDYVSHGEWYIDLKDGHSLFVNDLMGFSAGGKEVVIQWSSNSAIVSSFLRSCSKMAPSQRLGLMGDGKYMSLVAFASDTPLAEESTFQWKNQYGIPLWSTLYKTSRVITVYDPSVSPGKSPTLDDLAKISIVTRVPTGSICNFSAQKREFGYSHLVIDGHITYPLINCYISSGASLQVISGFTKMVEPIGSALSKSENWWDANKDKVGK